MLQNTFYYKVNSYDDYILKNELSFLKAIFEKLIKYTEDYIIITDNALNIIFSNSKTLSQHINILSKLKLNKKQIEQKSSVYSRFLTINNSKKYVDIFIEQIFIDDNSVEGYLFLIRDKTLLEKYKNKANNLLSFLQHDLKTLVLSQIMALKLIIKNDENKVLLPEILNSCENSYTLLKNIIDENTIEIFQNNILKDNVPANNFIKSIKDDSKKFLKSKNNKIVINDELQNLNINIDLHTLTKAFVNIIYQINERCVNKSIQINAKKQRNSIHFSFKSESEVLKKYFFDNEYTLNSNDKYEKLGYNSGLVYAGEIIKLHNGKIYTFQNERWGVLTVVIPI